MNIGIMGSADGPTQVYVTSAFLIRLIVGAVLLAAVVIFITRRKRKK